MHPEYVSSITDWDKFRRTYKGGHDFVDHYLVKFSAREDNNDFAERKKISYCPGFAKAAVNEVKNAIFQRIADVTRASDIPSYNDAVAGKKQGVDLTGSSMAKFIGSVVLPELLTIGKVGIFVDRAAFAAKTAADTAPPPYLYIYRAEDILSWNLQQFESGIELDAIHVRDYVSVTDADGFPETTKIRDRKLWRVEGGVRQVVDGVETLIPLSRIPFVFLELTGSLLEDVADYQIALLNLESSDIAYTLKSNFPFYTEQGNPTSTSHLVQKDEEGNEIKVGVVHGRRYPKGSERPDFISPPTDTLTASMDKQRQIKDDIRTLINLALSNVRPKFASAESKTFDERGLEAGLSAIGMVLEYAENEVAKIWAEYEAAATPPTISYPKRYSLKSDSEVLDEAKKIRETIDSVPSITFKREMSKQIVTTILGPKVQESVLKNIHDEIDKANVVVSDPDVIFTSVEKAILTREDAASAFAFPDNTEEAIEEHAEVAATIATAQAKVAQNTGLENPKERGVKDLDVEK